MELEEVVIEELGYQTILSTSLCVALNVNQYLLTSPINLHHKIVYKNLAIDFQKSKLLDLVELQFIQKAQRVNISIISYQFLLLLV
jgi:hypothetical protein